MGWFTTWGIVACSADLHGLHRQDDPWVHPIDRAIYIYKHWIEQSAGPTAWEQHIHDGMGGAAGHPNNIGVISVGKSDEYY